MFIQALLGFLDRKRQRWETRPRKTIKRYCKRWLIIDTLSVLPYDAVVVLIPSHAKLKINLVSAYSTADAGHSNMSEPFDNYIISLYWSVMTMSTIGYGDVTPKTQYERIYEIFGMILGASVYAYMVGAICSIVASMNAASAEFNQQMDSLNTFMAESQLPPSLRARLREFFRYRRSARSLHDCPALLQAMSPALRAQVASHTQAKWVNTVPFFRPLPEYLKTEIALALRTEAYAPNEPVMREGDKCDRLFIIDQGLLSSKGRLLGGGAIVGEQHFLLNKGRWSHSANTVTYTRLLSLDKDTFDE
ncbi:MAG: voltage-gated ion channel superfamily [Trebouxia sp. A1-2]|nr:MAG: voltage-gated ion channel superfamily [Trebouxia sp. A1-2]